MTSTAAMLALSPTIEAMRTAQAGWHALGLRARLRVLGPLAGLIAQHAEALAGEVVRPVPVSSGEILASELLPLAEASRYVVRRGGRILARVRLPRRDAAWWMGSIRVWQTREALGVVLVISPSNYPLLLPGVQLIQALAAGNAVLIKPAPGCAGVMERLAKLCVLSGVPERLIHVLPTDPEAARAAIAIGVDKVVLTGSRATGQAVARGLAESLTPAAFELSGNDAVFVLDDADPERVARSVAYALSLNGGQTCIAPRRLFATADCLQRLVPVLCREIERRRSAVPSDFGASGAMHGATNHRKPCGSPARAAIAEALAAGARLVCGDLSEWDAASIPKPLVLSGVQPTMRVATDDLFAPVLSLIEVSDMAAALECSHASRFALGASVFGSAAQAASVAAQVSAGCVTINDVLVPTADPRVSFGGWNASGYGVTRGPEGLREMTRLKVVCQRRGRWLPHLSTDPSESGPLMRGLLLLRHGRSLAQRWQGLKLLLKSMRRRSHDATVPLTLPTRHAS